MKLKIPSKTKIFVSILVLAVIAFGVYNLLWFRYIEISFNTFLRSEILQAIPEEYYKYFRTDRGWKIHSYRATDESSYSYTIAIPRYLEFGGNISILTPSKVDYIDGKEIYVSKCQVDLTIFPKNWRYVLSVADLTIVSQRGDNVRSIAMAVDKSGMPVKRSSNDSEAELYEEWLVLYNKYNDTIMKLFSDVKDYFGEDAFRK